VCLASRAMSLTRQQQPAGNEAADFTPLDAVCSTRAHELPQGVIHRLRSYEWCDDMRIKDNCVGTLAISRGPSRSMDPSRSPSNQG